MKLAISLTILCLLPRTVMAQTADCRTIPEAADRLACYDRTALSSPLEKPAMTKPATAQTTQKAAPDEQPAPLADLLAAENARLDAKIKSICRGC